MTNPKFTSIYANAFKLRDISLGVWIVSEINTGKFYCRTPACNILMKTHSRRFTCSFASNPHLCDGPRHSLQTPGFLSLPPWPITKTTRIIPLQSARYCGITDDTPINVNHGTRNSRVTNCNYSQNVPPDMNTATGVSLFEILMCLLIYTPSCFG